ncbi:LrgB-like family-domain-containing protein [Phialemonium atrogriseum]|uniref:LrgB-like family-domain-containing protein n=1 Tax=Phialemonium atrogriseum TaxID=1093897 RepID=A0AAJ0C466_9PEZI|nr:LrgB-like family-domain-containing protein [Phialemonium atrogriseum]KAK1767346.1 LrgB-like family-domain-containing protein [Phialemonium atrogriseum]
MADQIPRFATCVSEAFADGIVALKLTGRATAGSLLRSWLYVPFGIVLMLLAGWSLRWINVFFIPTFVLLPLSPSIGIVEVFKIIAVFILGFVAMMVLTAYMTRWLQILTGSSKRALTERAEELGVEDDQIPVTEAPPNESAPSSAVTSAAASTVALNTIQQPPRSQDPSLVRPQDAFQSFDDIVGGSETERRFGQPTQSPLAPLRSRQWAAFLTTNLDWITYLSIFFLVGIPVYYAKGYAMPLHLTITILAYFTAMMLPPQWRQYLHPVLVSALLTVLTTWVFALTRGQDLHTALTEYRTGLKYLQLWQGTKATTNSNNNQQQLLPGAGDVFGTVLDASIVSLALPMYQHRRELRSHFAAIVVPNVVLAAGSLFAYPPACRAAGIGAERALAFAARSLTLALAIPATDNLGGDANTVAAVAIMSGIVGALVGQRMLAMLKIPEDDYVTRGVTLGANSSAIATALLLRTDPRAAALSSLSMSLFGTVTVLLTSIPPIRDLVRSSVGL